MCMVQTDENSSLDSAEATLGEIGSSEPPHHRHSKRLSCSLRPFQLSLFLSPGVPKNQVPLLRGDAAGEPRRRRSRGLGSASTASETSSVLAQGRSTRGSRRRLQALHRSLARGGGGQAAGSQDRRHGSLKATLRGAQLSLKQRRRRRGARLSQGRAEGGKKLSAPCLFCSSGTKKKKTHSPTPSAFAPCSPHSAQHTNTPATTSCRMNALALRRCSVAMPSSSGRGASVRPNKEATPSTPSATIGRRRRTSSSIAAYK